MESSEIISEIKEIVKSQSGGNYSKWMIGRTNNSENSKIKRGEPNSWGDWDANSKEDADKVESYFMNKGMRQDSESYGSADFVYVFYIGSPQENN